MSPKWCTTSLWLYKHPPKEKRTGSVTMRMLRSTPKGLPRLIVHSLDNKDARVKKTLRAIRDAIPLVGRELGARLPHAFVPARVCELRDDLLYSCSLIFFGYERLHSLSGARIDIGHGGVSQSGKVDEAAGARDTREKADGIQLCRPTTRSGNLAHGQDLLFSTTAASVRRDFDSRYNFVEKLFGRSCFRRQ
jgi:hypothetical protein